MFVIQGSRGFVRNVGLKFGPNPARKVVLDLDDFHASLFGEVGELSTLLKSIFYDHKL